ncbi:hypothetical protein [Metabacillus litoralis]|jgi:hypothetical protein|nr:hypothetical protein [Metabacillus litoralis]
MKKIVKSLVKAAELYAKSAELYAKAQPEYTYFIKKIKEQK